jgi:hypothetical protein
MPVTGAKTDALFARLPHLSGGLETLRLRRCSIRPLTPIPSPSTEIATSLLTSS